MAFADSSCFQSCSFFMRSETRVPSAAFALARLFSAIEDFSVTTTICSFWANSRSVRSDVFEAQLGLLDLVFQEGLGVGGRFEPLVQIGGNEGVGISHGDLLRARRVGVGVGDIDQARAGKRAHVAVGQ